MHSLQAASRPRTRLVLAYITNPLLGTFAAATAQFTFNARPIRD